jgi:hypothetical protein
MDTRVRRIEYFHATVKDRPGEAFEILSRMRKSGVNLLAFSAVPCRLGTRSCPLPRRGEQLGERGGRIRHRAYRPAHAFLVQGDDKLGALADIHRRLFEGNINVYASNGVTDGKGGYGYVFYVKPEDYERAANVLDI